MHASLGGPTWEMMYHKNEFKHLRWQATGKMRIELAALGCISTLNHLTLLSGGTFSCSGANFSDLMQETSAQAGDRFRVHDTGYWGSLRSRIRQRIPALMSCESAGT